MSSKKNNLRNLQVELAVQWEVVSVEALVVEWEEKLEEAWAARKIIEASR